MQNSEFSSVDEPLRSPETHNAQEAIPEQEIREVFRMLAEIHLALHVVMDDEARKMREMEHAILLRDQRVAEERVELPEHQIAA